VIGTEMSVTKDRSVHVESEFIEPERWKLAGVIGAEISKTAACRK
jgi:hypothetical protein